MQIVSLDNLYKMSNLFSGQNRKNIINLSSAELAQRVGNCIHLVDFLHVLPGRQLLCLPVCLIAHQTPSEGTHSFLSE